MAQPQPAAGGRTKVPTFESGDSVEWKIWRERFEVIAEINGWEARRSRMEAKAAMAGNAATVVQDIPWGQNIAAANMPPIGDLLDLYEQRFVTPADSELAYAEFESARQLPEETLAQWHSRCRELFNRSNAGLDINDPLQGRAAVRAFARGLEGISMREYVFDRLAPATTYQQALQLAQTKEASLTMAKEEKNNNAAKRIGAIGTEDNHDQIIGAMAQAMKAGKCFLCGQQGHWKGECPVVQKALAQSIYIPAIVHNPQSPLPAAWEGPGEAQAKSGGVRTSKNFPREGQGRGGPRKGKGRGAAQPKGNRTGGAPGATHSISAVGNPPDDDLWAAAPDPGN